MNSKTTTPILGITVAVLFGISFIVYGGNAEADRDDPDFKARLTAEDVPPKPPAFPGPIESTSGASGKAYFWLNDDKTELYYKIILHDIDLTKTKPGKEAVTKLHFHVGPEDGNGPHVLNVFGKPTIDDADLKYSANVKKAKAVLKGKYDNGDANDLPHPGRTPNDSVPLTEFDPLIGKAPIDALCDGTFYVNVHSDKSGVGNDKFEDFAGAIRGTVVPTDDDVCQNGSDDDDDDDDDHDD